MNNSLNGLKIKSLTVTVILTTPKRSKSLSTMLRFRRKRKVPMAKKERKLRLQRGKEK